MNESPRPDLDDLDRRAVNAAFRRAPRLGRIVGTGIGFGAGVGLVVGLVLPNNTGVGRAIVVLLLATGFALICALVAGSVALALDARSVKRRQRPASTDEADA